jgi:hypothetical protein
VYVEARPGGPLQVTIRVNGEEFAQGQVPVSAPLLFSANECLDIGTCLGSPVSMDYYHLAPFPFDGTIERMHVQYLDTDQVASRGCCRTTFATGLVIVFRPIVACVRPKPKAVIHGRQPEEGRLGVPMLAVRPAIPVHRLVVADAPALPDVHQSLLGTGPGGLG